MSLRGLFASPQWKKCRPSVRWYCWLVVGLCTCSRICKVPGQNNFLSYSVPHVLEEFDFSYTQLGTIFSGATVAAALFQPFLGSLFDRYGARVCIPVSLAALSASCLFMSVLQHEPFRPLAYGEMVSVFFLLRALSMGALEIYPFACLQKWFSARLGTAVAVLGFFSAAGQALFAPIVSWLVESYGWRSWSIVAAILNAAAAIAAAALLRNGPEAVGIGLDGTLLEPPPKHDDDAAAIVDTMEVGEGEQGTVSEVATEGERPPETSSLWWPQILLILLFGFFFGVIFAGVDFYMLAILEETNPSSGSSGAMLVFTSLSASQAVSTPLLGFMSDSFKNNVACLFAILAVNAMTVAITLSLLTVASSPLLYVSYGMIRATNHSVDQAILSSGLMLLAIGAKKEAIGRMLGLWQLAKLAGTGFGPSVYGYSRDHFGSFQIGLLATSVPMLCLAAAFGCCLLANLPISWRRIRAVVRGYSPALTGGKQLEVAPGDEVAAAHADAELESVHLAAVDAEAAAKTSADADDV